MKKFISIVLILGLASLPAIAQNLIPLYITPKFQQYLDISSIEKYGNIEGNRYTIWFVSHLDYLSETLDPETNLYKDYAKTQWLIDCDKSEYQVTQTLTYYKDSNYIKSENSLDYYNKPESLFNNGPQDGRIIYNYVCTNYKIYQKRFTR